MTNKYKLVPLEPSSDQLNRAADVMKVQWQDSRSLQSKAVDIYKAMLEASPAQESEPVGEPFAYYVYVESEPKGYFVDDLDDPQLIDDCTNLQAEIRPLYTHPPADVEPVAEVAQYTFGNGGVFWFKECPPDGTKLCIYPYQVNSQLYDEALMSNKYLHLKLAKANLANKELVESLEGLYEDNMDYIRLNNLGAENNTWLVNAREALAKVKGE